MAASSDARTTWPPSGPLAFLKCRKHSEGAVHARQKVGDRHPDALNVGRSRAGQRHQPRLALCYLVVTGPAALGSVMAEAADGQDDQPRVDLGHPLLGKAKSIKDSRAEVLHQNVGSAQQRLEGRLAGIVLEVERHRLLVPVRAQEVGRFAVAVVGIDERRPPTAGVVAADPGSPP